LEEVAGKNSAPWSALQPGVVLLLILALVAGGVLGYTIRALQLPSAGSADVGFARDMIEHHRQAVEMSKLVYDRTEDEIIRSLAFDIMTTQQAQIGMMSGWLASWNHSVNSTGPRMEWMGMPVAGLMPGMATREQLNRLSEAQGVEADAIFLQLMIPHHRAGVEMSVAAMEQARSEVVRQLATSIAEAQDAEIEAMQQLLEEKGYERAPDAPLHSNGDMDMSHD
jgi:uncharacterized protein (DUF305 family)